ncbi:MAG: DUF1592 domain-containing protein [Bryobacterales bacterium]|nr:DUF1592 domain-containing protein [Bryobacterales bacterium]
MRSIILGYLSLVLVSAVCRAQPNFQTTVWPVLEQAQCRLCHNDNGVASTTQLRFPPESASAADIRAFSLGLRRFVDRNNPFQSKLLLKPTNRVAHAGGQRIAPGSAGESALTDWIAHLLTLPEAAFESADRKLGPSRPVLRRLTHSQYNHTVADLLDDQTRPADAFPKEDYVHGFTNQAEGQSISPLQAEAYAKAAERLARNAFRGGDQRKLVGCEPSPGCAERFVRSFGRRAFRRPLTDLEVKRYRTLMASQTDQLAGAQMVVEAMLQSPHFLFHLGTGQFAIASRLSYFVWDTMPDEELLKAAERGELGTSAGIEKQVVRMLKDERAQPALDEFLAQWLRFDRLRSAIRDRRLFPEFTTELVNSMSQETTRLFRHLVWGDQDFMQFFKARYSFLDPELANLYKVTAPKEIWGKVEFPQDSVRAGILGQGTFLALTSKPSDTSPTERGIFVREHFLCQIVPPPPPGLNATLPPVTDERPLSTRDRLVKVHLTNRVCAGCHLLVDPIGFGLEQFDAIGRFRQKERVVIYPTFDEMKTKRKEKPTEYQMDIEPRGQISGIVDSDFASPRQLGELLANEPNCQKCVVKQLFRYATGRREETEDGPVVEAALERFRRSGFRFRELIMAISMSETFRSME